ncbi:hypothetical protein V8E52_009110 [Russula decolorans]
MQKLLVAFVSVVTLMGLVAPSSAHAIQERNGDRPARGLTPLVPTRRDDGSHPQPSHHFKHKYHGQPEQRDLSERPPSRRGEANHPQPSHQFKHKDHGHGDDDQGHNHQERNSDRLARGLPPLPPSRRDSAKPSQPSHHSKHQGDGTDNHIEIRDTSGNSLGYLTDFTGSGQDLSVNYNSGAHTLSFDGDNLGDAHYLGASVSKSDLGSNSPAFVYLTNVGTHDQQANADIWSLDGNQLTATWKNSDGTTAPVHFCLNSAGDSIVLAGDPSLLPAGYKEVYFNL